MLTRFCCFRLRTAAVVIGWIEVVSALISFALIGLLFGFADNVADELIKNALKYTKVEMLRAIFVLGSIHLLISVIQLISASLLIYGTVNERHLLLVPWLINNAVILVFALVVGIMSFSTGLTAPGIGLALLAITIRLYLWCAMQSLFKEIRETRREGRLLIPRTGSNYSALEK